MESGWDGMDGAHSRRLSISVPTAPRLRRGGAGGRRGRGLAAGRTRTPRARLCHGPRPAFGEGTALPLRPARTAPTWPFQAPPAGRAAPHVLPRSGLGHCSWPGRSSGEGARRPRARQRHTRARTTRAATTRDAGANPIFRGVPRGKFPALRGYRSSHHRFTCPGFCDYKRL